MHVNEQYFFMMRPIDRSFANMLHDYLHLTVVYTLVS